MLESTLLNKFVAKLKLRYSTVIRWSDMKKNLICIFIDIDNFFENKVKTYKSIY